MSAKDNTFRRTTWRESFDISSFHHILCPHFGAPKWVSRQKRCWFWGIFEACWLGDGDSRWWILFPNQETQNNRFFLHRKWKTEHISRTEQWKRSPSWFMIRSGVMLPNILGIIGFKDIGSLQIYSGHIIHDVMEHILGTVHIRSIKHFFFLGCKTWRCIPGHRKRCYGSCFKMALDMGCIRPVTMVFFHSLQSSIFGWHPQ